MLIMCDIMRTTENRVVDHKVVEHQVDVIICDIGLDISFLPSFTLKGLRGQNL